MGIRPTPGPGSTVLTRRYSDPGPPLTDQSSRLLLLRCGFGASEWLQQADLITFGPVATRHPGDTRSALRRSVPTRPGGPYTPQRFPPRRSKRQLLRPRWASWRRGSRAQTPRWVPPQRVLRAAPATSSECPPSQDLRRDPTPNRRDTPRPRSGLPRPAASRSTEVPKPRHSLQPRIRTS